MNDVLILAIVLVVFVVGFEIFRALILKRKLSTIVDEVVTFVLSRIL
jgi:hypothetical protein